MGCNKDIAIVCNKNQNEILPLKIRIELLSFEIINELKTYWTSVINQKLN